MCLGVISTLHLAYVHCKERRKKLFGSGTHVWGSCQSDLLVERPLVTLPHTTMELLTGFWQGTRSLEVLRMNCERHLFAPRHIEAYNGRWQSGLFTWQPLKPTFTAQTLVFPAQEPARPWKYLYGFMIGIWRRLRFVNTIAPWACQEFWQWRGQPLRVS